MRRAKNSKFHYYCYKCKEFQHLAYFLGWDGKSEMVCDDCLDKEKSK